MINDQPAFDRGARPDYGPQAYSGSAEGKKKILSILKYMGLQNNFWEFDCFFSKKFFLFTFKRSEDWDLKLVLEQ